MCPFCDTALVVDGSATLFHEVMIPTVDAARRPRPTCGASSAGATPWPTSTARRPSTRRVLEYFPFWAFTVAGPEGDRVVLQPAAPSSLQGLQGLGLPAGTTRPMSAEATGGAAVVEPEVPVETAREWLATRFGSEVAIRRTVLYHLPLYRTSYSWRGKSYRAAVDGVSGRVFPADFPAKAEAPYVMVAALALVVFGVEGILISNPALKLIAYVVSALPIVGVAWLTMKKGLT